MVLSLGNHLAVLYRDSVYMCECTTIWTWAILSFHIAVTQCHSRSQLYCLTNLYHITVFQNGCTKSIATEDTDPVCLAYHLLPYTMPTILLFLTTGVKCVLFCGWHSNAINTVYVHTYIEHSNSYVCIWCFSIEGYCTHYHRHLASWSWLASSDYSISANTHSEW